MQLPIKIAEVNSGNHLEVDAYDDGFDRLATITQPMTKESVSFDFRHIDELIEALTELKQGFESGWEQPEESMEIVS